MMCLFLAVELYFIKSPTLQCHAEGHDILQCHCIQNRANLSCHIQINKSTIVNYLISRELGEARMVILDPSMSHNYVTIHFHNKSKINLSKEIFKL